MTLQEAKDQVAKNNQFENWTALYDYYKDGAYHIERIAFEAAELYARSKSEKLQKFKDYVHDRLDKMDVPVNPEPENNQAHGCRIEGRLNFVERMIKLR